MQNDKVELKNVRTITVNWNDEEGNYVYSLTSLLEYPTGERSWQSKYSGDQAWAERIAAHYQLQVPVVNDGTPSQTPDSEQVKAPVEAVAEAAA